MADLGKAGSLATIALGLGQALAPRATGRAFGLAELDGQAVWLARLLGASNIALGSIGLDPDVRAKVQPTTYAVLAGHAASTLTSGRSGGIPKRTAGLVLGFVAALAAADVAAGRAA